MTEQQIKQRAREILEKMTLEEKIGQVSQFPYRDMTVEEMQAFIREKKPGSLILCNSPLGGQVEQQEVNLDEINLLQKAAMESCGIPLVCGRDVIHGHHVAFPVPLTMTASWDFDLIRESYDAIREEAINDGVKWTFTPMLDMCREPRWGRIVEGTGEDPYLGECFAKAAVKGFQTENPADERAMFACAKHYIGYGASEGGRDYNHTEISEYSLQNYYLPAFRAAVDSGVATVMSAFNDINGIPASGNKKTLTDILRGQLGFEGFVVSDWGAVEQMADFAGFAEDHRDAVRIALSAGVDLDMANGLYSDHIPSLLESGELTEEQLDTAVLHLLETKLRHGLFDHPYIERRAYDSEKHLQLAQTLAEKSIVLLKNENNVLPLSKDAKICVSGEMATATTDLVGTWALDYDKSLSHSVLQVLRDKVGAYTVRAEAAYKHSLREDPDAYVVVLGDTLGVTGEATALADIRISEKQLSVVRMLKRTGKPIIGVFCFARPMVFGEEEYLFDAILYAGHGGSRAAQAIAAVLFGEAEPEGRLPFTLMYHQGQLPLYYNSLPGSRQINEYYHDVNPMHANYSDCHGSPLYPFGYGLAYTTFDYSAVSCDVTEKTVADMENGETFRFAVTVKNIGARVGVAVPQLYVWDMVGSRIRPLRVLRNFRKLSLLPGEQQTVQFEVGKKDLGFYLEDGTFIVEKGDFKIFVGENCQTENKIEIMLT